MATDVKLSSEFTIIYGGEVIAYCTDFNLERNKEIIDITKLGDTWKNKKVDTKDFNVSFNGMVTRGDTVTASLWNSATAYSSGDYVVIAGKAWEAQGSTTGDNPTTDDGTNWLETSAWSSGTTYDAGDMVYITSEAQETRIYKSLQGSNTNNDPLTETAYWERLTTNYESLLKELRNNDTEVLCTIKPTTSGETYYYGNGVLTSLSASITQGDKATFSGSFEGSGELSAQTEAYGAELFTSSNAAADPNGSEANATTGLSHYGLGGANTFQSQSGVVNVGSYAIECDLMSNPVSAAGCYIDLSLAPYSCVNGDEVKIEWDWRQKGVGGGNGNWRCYLGLTRGGQEGGYIGTDIDKTDTSFISELGEFVYSANTQYVMWREWNPENDGGIYLDNISIKKKV